MIKKKRKTMNEENKPTLNVIYQGILEAIFATNDSIAIGHGNHFKTLHTRKVHFIMKSKCR